MIQSDLFANTNTTAQERPKPDLEKARDYFKAWTGKWFTPEQVQREARLTIGVPALARKMRLFRQHGLLESRIREGRTYKEYTWKGE